MHDLHFKVTPTVKIIRVTVSHAFRKTVIVSCFGLLKYFVIIKYTKFG